MPGWLRSAGSGPLTWMLSNATSTAWIAPKNINRPQRKGRQGKRNENQSDQLIRRRPGQGSALLYGGTGFCQEVRFQQWPISLADRGLARGAGGHRAAVGAEQQPRSQSVSAGDF